MTATDYSGLDFCIAIGEVYGLRTWRVDQYGRLRALHVSLAAAWRPGVNTAECHKDKYASGGLVFPSWHSSLTASLVTAYDQATGMVTVKPAGPEQKPEPQPEPPHETPTEGCPCGFYAYTDPRHEENGYRGEGFVTGIVRGTGRTLIGTKGFRCEKAEIVALIDPTRDGRKTAEWRVEQKAKLARVYPDVPLLPSRAALLEFAPIESTLPDPSTDEFWSLP